MVNSLVWQHVHVRQELEKDKVTTTKRICSNATPLPFLGRLYFKPPLQIHLLALLVLSAAPTNGLIYMGGFISSRPYKLDVLLYFLVWNYDFWKIIYRGGSISNRPYKF